ncbi:hypothetical protein HYH02_013145 [Chlamydomonas schloesseri]|uniref:Methylated-DNA--protein-cysteine methyltransferase n=1 Tax=Chlamydomonas schloesseri TaxID=2026947 RepID=A0A835SU70_9CHLO|nr:hypothetical protein HYH02_013145 [Chlamydomonas schloesseri]|eukprot:KAG2431926.1 hypothetical protein HYH02_013145 [Chlamydomonas schloesseri]
MPKRKQEDASSGPQPQQAPAGAPQAGDAPGDTALTASDKPNRPPTAFENRLYELCKCIPKGKVSTYGAMAVVLESAPRAVGQALRRNPFCPVVPCHRVVAADLNIGGFSGGWGISDPKVQRKRRLLEEEGVGFEEAGAAVGGKGAAAAAAEGTCRVLKQFVLGPAELRGLQQQGQQQKSNDGKGGAAQENDVAAGGGGAASVKGRGKKKRV